jgi:hypothetical protein
VSSTSPRHFQYTLVGSHHESSRVAQNTTNTTSKTSSWDSNINNTKTHRLQTCNNNHRTSQLSSYPTNMSLGSRLRTTFSRKSSDLSTTSSSQSSGSNNSDRKSPTRFSNFFRLRKSASNSSSSSNTSTSSTSSRDNGDNGEDDGPFIHPPLKYSARPDKATVALLSKWEWNGGATNLPQEGWRSGREANQCSRCFFLFEDCECTGFEGFDVGPDMRGEGRRWDRYGGLEGC